MHSSTHESTRPVRLSTTLSMPSNKPQTIQQKADEYGPRMIWQPVPGNKRAMSFISPCSGRIHTIRWNGDADKWTCSCEAGRAGRDCYHIREFERELEGFIEYGNIVLSATIQAAPKPSVYSVAVNTPKRSGFDSEAEFNAAAEADFS